MVDVGSFGSSRNRKPLTMSSPSGLSMKATDHLYDLQLNNTGDVIPIAESGRKPSEAWQELIDADLVTANSSGRIIEYFLTPAGQQWPRRP